MTQKKLTIEDNKRRAIIAIAVIAAIVLYMSGVLSGLYANKILKKETEEDISLFKLETKSGLEDMRSYISFLESNLNSIQLEQIFVETLEHDQMCEFSSISLNNLVEQLRFYWQRLPFRIEEYEKNNRQTEEYKLLKQQYTQISLRTWIIARSLQQKCDTDLVHGLYFYNADCDLCITQGEELDKLKRTLDKKGTDVLIFTIDFDSKEPLVGYLRDYYRLNSTPSVVINDEVFTGKVFASQELTGT
ncbi:hypothetical protein GOV08_03185 [Candidatus Woesearchaeota archaeon]|nr:hypothetical protein [Candidatus Woesearchaeota archaeon]